MTWLQGQAFMLRKSAPGDAAQSWASLVDTSVYSRNRHFRLLGSCKAGKAAVLLPSGRYATAPGAPGVTHVLPPEVSSSSSDCVTCKIRVCRLETDVLFRRHPCSRRCAASERRVPKHSVRIRIASGQPSAVRHPPPVQRCSEIMCCVPVGSCGSCCYELCRQDAA